MSDKPSTFRRILNAIAPESPIDREAHAERVLDVVETSKQVPAPRPRPYGPGESSRPDPEKESRP